ncbi:hypothetical protein [Luteimonas sp. 100069]|uniref:hypothetical protein n=1 Tax=Luteimonas sp. 100069 TaxID=2006109 RepID=UPI000F4D6451|nr:hypothetical protein [Luteimonas sp. 100069]
MALSSAAAGSAATGNVQICDRIGVPEHRITKNARISRHRGYMSTAMLGPRSDEEIPMRHILFPMAAAISLALAACNDNRPADTPATTPAAPTTDSAPAPAHPANEPVTPPPTTDPTSPTPVDPSMPPPTNPSMPPPTDPTMDPMPQPPTDPTTDPAATPTTAGSAASDT